MVDISVVVCSRETELLKNLQENIKATIGCRHEIISVDNKENQYSIFEAYNLGIQKSKFEIICFLHEDIQIHTRNWGKIIHRLFVEHKEAGIIGLAGSKVKSNVPAGWWEHERRFLVKNLIQHRPNGVKEHIELGFEAGDLQEAVIVDGVFISMKKKKGVCFNEMLEGFHNYDQSICLDYIKKGHKVFVTNQVLIEHFSNGRIDGTWVNSMHKFHRLYKNDLPKVVSGTAIDKVQREKYLINYIIHCKSTGNQKLAFLYWLKLLKQNPLSKKHKFLLSDFWRYFITK
ncbi:glycosyltransferase [Salinimicrobium sediminilitoris]|uniref:glycosyltransferase n=1 Tax=Salinimicrobium sediminilitoris TaxID=2876715 RepID=UPI001E57CC33|nr:glycosyltransferase [Salinimicrobium sediminilitoris]MCC8358517.1 glycosyltransferase family protein [Salinimicrobium sediminilitoris]